jgi:hypothetical protein
LTFLPWAEAPPKIPSHDPHPGLPDRRSRCISIVLHDF